MPLAPGTIVEGSSDPRTVEQNAAIRGMQTQSTGEVGSQYSGSLILPDGTVTRDLQYVNPNVRTSPNFQAALNAAGKTNADGSISGGYLFILNTEGYVVQFYGVSAGAAQTVAERAMAVAVSPAMQSSGITHRAAIELAISGVQTDGTPVTDSYLTLIERWAREEGIPFTRPSVAQVAAINTPVPASVVVASGQGVSAVSPVPFVQYETFKPSPVKAPTFTQGATIPEDFAPAVLRVPTNPPEQVVRAPVTMTAAETPTAPATSVTQDASVAAAAVQTKYIIGGVIAALVVVYLATRK